MKTSNILILAPHPDDEVLGCGATMRKKVIEGNNVYVSVLTNAHKTDPHKYTLDKMLNIRNEALKAHDVLGVKETYFEDFPAPALDQFPQYKISEYISGLIKKLDIGILYIPHRGDIHNDHKVIYDAALVAARPNGTNKIRKILAYETLSETEWAHPFANDAFIPTHFEIIEEDIFEAKLAAMRCYASQLREFPSSRSLEALTSLAKLRGSTVNTHRAEAFMIVRSIS